MLGMLALERKEELQIAIEEQQEMGLEGLGEEDKYLMEINLDLESTSGANNCICMSCLLIDIYVKSGLRSCGRRDNPRP